MLRLRCRIKIKHKGEILMSIVNDTSFSFNKQFKFNFNGGELSSDDGLFLLKEFAHRIGFEKVIRDNFQTNDSAVFRFHTDDKNLMQRIYQIIVGYFNDNDADELTKDPAFCAVLCKDTLASQPTMSLFFIRMNEDSFSSSRRFFISCAGRSTGPGHRKTFSYIWIPHSCRLTPIRRGKVLTTITGATDVIRCYAITA